MVSNDAVLQLWAKGPKDVLLFVKRNRKKAEELLARYLDAMPAIETRFIGGNTHTGYLCADWITNLAMDGSLHCAHCINERSCDFQCWGAYRYLLDQFCSICTINDRKRCRRDVTKYLETMIRERKWLGFPLKSDARYMASMRFHDEGTNVGFAGCVVVDIVLDNANPRMAIGEDDKFSRMSDILHDFASNWVDPIDEDKTGFRRIIEIALTVISFNYAYFSDLTNSTLFLNTPYTDLEELYQGNPDQRERAVSLSKEMVVSAAKTLEAIYKSDFLPSLSDRKIYPPYIALIDLGVQEGKIRDYNEIHQSLPGREIYTYDWEIDPQFLQYVLYTGLAKLIIEALKIRFTNKIALPFRDDNLLSIYKTLESSNDIKDCCHRLGLPYKTVHSGICSNLKDHPRYGKYVVEKHSQKGYNYRKIHPFIVESTEEEIKQWNDKVNSRLK